MDADTSTIEKPDAEESRHQGNSIDELEVGTSPSGFVENPGRTDEHRQIAEMGGKGTNGC